MLNLLRFKEVADYSNSPELAPTEPLSGKKAYQVYMISVGGQLNKMGAKVNFMGPCGDFVIGPSSESWDMMLLVEYPSVEVFMAFTQSEHYQKFAGHRTAAVEDSRLLPISPPD